MKKSIFFKAGFISIILLTAGIIYSCSNPSMHGGDDLLTGEFTRADWNNYVNSDAGGYEPNQEIVEELRSIIHSDDIEFIMMAGAWCIDSKVEMPRFFLLCDSLGMSEEKIRLYGVDMNKHEPGGMHKIMNLEKVPTLAVFRGGKEIGRIVERPVDSWEKSILNIVK